MLKILNLGGTESVTKNLTVYEYQDDILVVDCGVGFPDSEMLGIDMVIPDFTYLQENREKIRGLLLTHGHEDHIGAVPYFLKEFPHTKVYASKLVQGFLREKFTDEKRYKDVPANPSFGLLSAGMPPIKLGAFTIETFGVNHSVPDSLGFAIKTPEGTVLHISDFKIDFMPVLDKPIELGKIAKYGEEGVLCLLSDCLGVTTEGYSKPERELINTFDSLFSQANDKQIIVTTISSNISRIHQIVTSAKKLGKRVVILGRSIDQSISVARGLNYLSFDDNMFVSSKDAQKYNQSDLVYIVAGCYGQPDSALAKISRGEHPEVIIQNEALVVFSADPNPPGVAEAVEKVQDSLITLGARVVYSEIQDNLHVSGHGTKGDLKLVAFLSKAKYFIPIGGTIKRMRAYSNMISSLGIETSRVFEQREGDSVLFTNGEATKGESFPVRAVFVDGANIGDVGSSVLKDRERLSDDGMFVVIVPISAETGEFMGKVEIITRGFVYVKESGELLSKAKQSIVGILTSKENLRKDWNTAKDEVEKRMNKLLFKETGRNPLIFIQTLYL